MTLRFSLLPALSTLCFLALFSCTNAPKTGPDDMLVNGVSIPKLLPRKEGIGPDAEAKQIQITYDEATAKIKEDTAKAAPYLKLATAFIAEGRVSGNGGYYSNAAIRMLDKTLNAEGVTVEERFQALSLKSTALLNLHRFEDALKVAQQGLQINDYSAALFGALVDANVELGHYAEAVQDCDKMLAIRPDLRSYSRASYLRQLNGDLRGAAVAMKMAVESSVAGEENTEWARITLGDIYLHIGSLDTARICYNTALQVRPNYAPAEMGLARAAAAEGKYDTAIAHARTAVKALPEAAYVSYLADLYAMSGNTQKATEIRKDVLEKLLEAEKDAAKQGVPHNGARELAQAYLAVGNKDEALKMAQQDWKTRPENIDANDLLGWILYQKGDYAGARKCAMTALAFHTANPPLLYRTGLILSKAGDAAKGDSLMNAGKKGQPFLEKAVTAGAL